MKKVLALALALVMCLTLFSACGDQKSTSSAGTATDTGKVLKIAVILPGAKDDVSFNQAMYEGMKKIESEYGSKIQVSYVENVYDVADITPTLIDYAEQKYDIVFGHGFQFMEPIMEIASQYPDTVFMTGTGYKTADNVGFYNTHLASGGYVMGYMAGLITKTDKVGVIGGSNVAEIFQGQEGFKDGAKAANPKVSIEEVYTGDFNDTPLAKTTADGMYQGGADIIWHSGDGIGLGVVQSAKENNKYCLTNAADQHSLAPQNVVSGVIYHWETVIRSIIDDVAAGKFASGDKAYWCDVENGGVEIAAPMDGVLTAEQTQQVNKLIDQIKTGEKAIPEYPSK